MNIGYDFDGVLHKNVSEVDGLGERNYERNTELIKFTKIIKLIKKQKDKKCNLFIISRGDKKTVIENLKKLNLLEYFDKVITDLGHRRICKSDVIIKEGITAFYDDSVYNIHSINRRIKRNELDTRLFLVYPEKNSFTEIKRNNIKVLTYNVCWKNIYAQNAIIKECNRDGLCASNINSLILNELPLDFIFIQEYGVPDILLNGLQHDYVLVKTKSGKEEMATIINKKYDVIQIIKGEFYSGRPFLITILTNIILINVHFEHRVDLNEELHKIEIALKRHKIKYDDYRIIMGGDFNMDIGKNIKLGNTKLYNYRKKYTCCLYSTHMNNDKDILKYIKGRNIDHILDSEDIPVYQITLTPHKNNKLTPASDHLAVYAELN